MFEREEDAQRVLRVLPRRLGRFGLKLHPEKTRLVDFCRPRGSRRNGAGHTFEMLGFTHLWGKSRAGRWAVKRKTAKDRLSSALKRVGQWCRRNRHWRVADQHMGAESQAAGPLRLLRRDRQRAVAELLPPSGGTPVAEMAGSTFPCRTPGLGCVSTAPGPVPACNTSNHARIAPPGANPYAKEPDAGVLHVRIWCARRTGRR